jgi:adenylate kinase
VVGVPGVGKTTIVGKLNRAIRGSKVVTFGTVMLDEGKRLGWIRHRDELRKLPVEKQKQLQKLTAARIASMKSKVLFVDTHLFIRTNEGFWPGLPFEVVRALKPTHLILVEADPKEILSRRQNDKTRYRDDVTTKDLEGELSLARGFLTVASMLTGAPMRIASNRHGKSTEVAKGLAKVLAGAAR